MSIFKLSRMVKMRLWAIIVGGFIVITGWQQFGGSDAFDKKPISQVQSTSQALQKPGPGYLGKKNKTPTQKPGNLPGKFAPSNANQKHRSQKESQFKPVGEDDPIKLEPSNYSEQDLMRLKETNSCKGCNLEGINLDRMDLRGVDLRNANLKGASFLGSNLKYSKFRNANLENARFSEANLEQSSFMGAELNHADLQGVTATMADFTNSNLTHTNMTASQLNGIHFNDAILEGTNFEEANLTFSDFNQADTSRTNFRKADLSGALNMEWELINEDFLCGTTLPNKDKFRRCH